MKQLKTMLQGYLQRLIHDNYSMTIGRFVLIMDANREQLWCKVPFLSRFLQKQIEIARENAVLLLSPEEHKRLQDKNLQFRYLRLRCVCLETMYLHLAVGGRSEVILKDYAENYGTEFIGEESLQPVLSEWELCRDRMARVANEMKQDEEQNNESGRDYSMQDMINSVENFIGAPIAENTTLINFASKLKLANERSKAQKTEQK